MKVLSFGNIPSWAGGKNDCGLSNVIFQLAYHISQIENVEMTLVATDVKKALIYKNKLKIMGWSVKSLIMYALTKPHKTILFVCKTIFYQYRYRQPESFWGLVFKLLYLNKMVYKFQPDIVHLHTASSLLYLNAIPKHIKIVLTIHGILGNDINYFNSSNYRKLEEDCCKSNRFNKIYFISENLISAFVKEYGKITPPVETVINAYDKEVFYYKGEKENNGKIKIITIATLSNIKGQERVLSAIAKIGLDCTYECVGSDSDGLIEKLQEIADLNHIDYRYYGKLSPNLISELLCNSDYMILPSSTEGFGLVYLEAIACGTPVILPKGLPIVGEPNIILPGINSILLEDSSTESIAKVLTKLRKNTFDRKKISETVSWINWDYVADRYVTSFSKLN